MQEIASYAERMRKTAEIRFHLRQKLLESMVDERKIKFCKTRMEEGGGVANRFGCVMNQQITRQPFHQMKQRSTGIIISKNK